MFDHIEEMVGWDCPSCGKRLIGMNNAYRHGLTCHEAAPASPGIEQEREIHTIMSLEREYAIEVLKRHGSNGFMVPEMIEVLRGWGKWLARAQQGKGMETK